LSGEAHANAFTGSDRTHIAFFHVRYHPCQLLETTVTAVPAGSQTSSARCRGIRRICPKNPLSACERARSVCSIFRPRMAHCLRANFQLSKSCNPSPPGDSTAHLQLC
jgi:hypothetical protein